MMFYQILIAIFAGICTTGLSIVNMLFRERRISYSMQGYIGLPLVISIIFSLLWLIGIHNTKDRQIEYRPYDDTHQIKITKTIPNYYCGVWCDEVKLEFEAIK